MAEVPSLTIDWPDGHQLQHVITHINLIPFTGRKFGYVFSESLPNDPMAALAQMIRVLAPHVPHYCTWSVTL